LGRKHVNGFTAALDKAGGFLHGLTVRRVQTCRVINPDDTSAGILPGKYCDLFVRNATLLPAPGSGDVLPRSFVAASLVDDGHRRNGFIGAAAAELFPVRPESARRRRSLRRA